MCTAPYPPDRSRKTKRTFLLFLLAFGFAWVTQPLVWSYEVIPSFSGSHLRGTVALKGPVPSPKRFNLVLYADPYYCGRISDGNGWRIAPLAQVGPNHELAGAVVYLEHVKSGKRGNGASPLIQTKNCVYLPYISAAQTGQSMQFQNWDPVLHKLEILGLSPRGAIPLLAQNLSPHPDIRKSDFLSGSQKGVHRSGKDMPFDLEFPGVLVFRCQLHDYMEGWTIVLPHPYFSLTAEDGTFSLTNIPEGKYNLIVWHPLGKQKVTIDIPPDAAKDLNIVLHPTLPIQLEEQVPVNPFGIDLVGDSHIVPSVEVQKFPTEGLTKERSRQ